MKIFLVVMFLMQDGTWLPGDVIAPDGWSALPFETMEQCDAAENRINENFGNSPFAGKVYGICVDMEAGTET